MDLHTARDLLSLVEEHMLGMLLDTEVPKEWLFHENRSPVPISKLLIIGTLLRSSHPISFRMLMVLHAKLNKQPFRTRDFRLHDCCTGDASSDFLENGGNS